VDPVVEQLIAGGFSVSLASFSALDRFCGLRPGPVRRIATNADQADLSRLFDGLRFPGVEVADAAVDLVLPNGEGATWLIRCVEDQAPAWTTFSVLSFSWDAVRKAYRDPDDLYDMVRALREPGRAAPPWAAPEEIVRGTGKIRAALDAALILSRYRGAAEAPEASLAALARTVEALPEDVPPAVEAQRHFLSALMVSRRPDLGLALLKRIGFIDDAWPELAAMDEVDHAKEYHPEGNAWTHTLETFKYRKIADLGLSLALLLHDSGKPLAEASGGRRFDRHAELGAATTRRFLGRLGFAAPLVEQVDFLVRNHMLPAALPRLPLTRTQTALESPYFPLLLELYRCDEASSFKDSGGFYAGAAAYRSYLRNVKNPYRSADGKKMMKHLFSGR
jgi:poly(A) polymerase